MQRNFNLIDLVKSFPTSSTQTKVTPELFLSRDGELRDIQEEFSECVRDMLRPFVQIFIFQFLSMSLFLNLLLEPDPYSNECLVTKFQIWLRYSRERVLGLPEGGKTAG